MSTELSLQLRIAIYLLDDCHHSVKEISYFLNKFAIIKDKLEESNTGELFEASLHNLCETTFDYYNIRTFIDEEIYKYEENPEAYCFETPVITEGMEAR